MLPVKKMISRQNANTQIGSVAVAPIGHWSTKSNGGFFIKKKVNFSLNDNEMNMNSKKFSFWRPIDEARKADRWDLHQTDWYWNISMKISPSTNELRLPIREPRMCRGVLLRAEDKNKKRERKREWDRAPRRSDWSADRALECDPFLFLPAAVPLLACDHYFVGPIRTCGFCGHQIWCSPRRNGRRRAGGLISSTASRMIKKLAAFLLLFLLLLRRTVDERAFHRRRRSLIQLFFFSYSPFLQFRPFDSSFSGGHLAAPWEAAVISVESRRLFLIFIFFLSLSPVFFFALAFFLFRSKAAGSEWVIVSYHHFFWQ